MTTSTPRIITNQQGRRFVAFDLDNARTKARSMQPVEIGNMVSKILDAGHSGDEHALDGYGDVLGTSQDLQQLKH